MTAILVAPCSFLFEDQSGKTLTAGEADLTLEKETLSLLPKFDQPIHLQLADVSQISLGDYVVSIGLLSGEMLRLRDIGYKFGDLVSNLYSAWNEVVVKHLLMNDSLVRPPLSAELSLFEPAGEKRVHDSSEIRIYETSLVLIPTNSEPLRVHFSNVSKVESHDYSIAIETSLGRRIVISKVGQEFDNFSRDLSNAMNALSMKTLELIKEISPSSSAIVAGTAARLLKDGKAESSAEIKAVAPILWNDLQKMIEKSKVSKEYQFLRSISQRDEISIGVKRGLMGDITGNYIWILIPIYGATNYGNAVAMETIRMIAPETDQESKVSDEASAGGNATYFFRITGRENYSRLLKNTANLNEEIDNFVRKLSESLLDINFRREPILLSDDKLATEPQHAKYRYAVRKIASLQELRKLFIGRVIHSSFDQWKSDIEGLLIFNNSAPDGARWEK